MDLALATRLAADRIVLEVGGEVDVYTAPKLRERLIELSEAGALHVIVDLGKVEFLDSTGLGVLIGARKRLRGAGGSLVLVCSRDPLLKLFHVTALDKVFTIVDSVAAAADISPTAD